MMVAGHISFTILIDRKVHPVGSKKEGKDQESIQSSYIILSITLRRFSLYPSS